MKQIQWLTAVLVGTGALALAEPAAQPPAVPATPSETPRGGAAANPEMARERMRRMMMGGDSEGMILRMLSSDSKMVQELGLSDTQVKELKESTSGGETEMKDLNAKLEQAAMRQAELMKADTLDEEALMKAVQETGELRTQIAKRRIKQLIAAHKVLTVEQRAKLRELMSQRMAQMRDRWQQSGRQPGAAGGPERRRNRGEGASVPPVPPAPPAPAVPPAPAP